MSHQQSLFDPITPIYPEGPGSKEVGGASEDAAVKISDKVKHLQGLCVGVLTKGDHTADEVADILHMDILTIRPRLSELRKRRLVESTGIRRASSRGNSSTVWTLT